MDKPLTDALDIREVARRTGLTSRALRFYEARGLVQPLRTYSGRRLYGPGELERINQIIALKRAGMTLSQIAVLTTGRQADLRAFLEAQLEALDAKRAELDEARSLILSVKSRVDRGEPVDAATFCSLIENKELMMSKDQWDKVSDRFFTQEQKAQFAKAMEEVPSDFDQADYSRKWADLGKRVEAAIPNGVQSPEAQALYDEWQELLAPFTAVASPEMMKGVSTMYERMDEWKGEVPSAPFTPEAYRFIQEIGRGRKACG